MEMEGQQTMPALGTTSTTCRMSESAPAAPAAVPSAGASRLLVAPSAVTALSMPLINPVMPSEGSVGNSEPNRISVPSGAASSSSRSSLPPSAVPSISSSIPSSEPVSTSARNGANGAVTTTTIMASGGILLGTPDDRRWFSEIVCLMRAQIEIFAATPADVEARRKIGGAKNPPSVGRVGIRCTHCAHIPPSKRGKGSDSYPKSMKLIFQAVRNFQRYHFTTCRFIPVGTKATFERLQNSQKLYSARSCLKWWVEGCKSLGMIDTDGDGIHLRDDVAAAAGVVRDSCGGATGDDVNSIKEEQARPSTGKADNTKETKDDRPPGRGDKRGVAASQAPVSATDVALLLHFGSSQSRK